MVTSMILNVDPVPSLLIIHIGVCIVILFAFLCFWCKERLPVAYNFLFSLVCTHDHGRTLAKSCMSGCLQSTASWQRRK